MSIADSRWLVFDRRSDVGDRPGAHALVIGVSAYKHLSGGAENDSSQIAGLTQLSVAARSAYVFHNWLRNNADRLAFPLKTLRLLLAPSPSEAPEIEKPEHCQTEVCFDDFLDAVYSWREDASHSRDDAAVFYFCGHGFDLGTSDPVIALGDFGSPRGPVLAGTVAVNHLVQGLAPSELLPDVARTQLFFIDSGRRPMSFAYEWTKMSAPPVFDLGRPWLDDRQLAVCHASSPGEQAWAVLGGTTFFLAGLLRCLQGEAAVLHGGSGPTEPAPPWQVTVASLVRTLPSTVQRLTEKQLPSEQRVFVKAIMSREVVLYRLDSAPLVTVTVEFEPAEVAPRAAFEIRKGDGSLVEIAEGSRASDRRELILPAGFYAVRVSFLPAAGATEPAEKDVNFFSQLLPPQAIWRVEVPS